MEQLSHRNALSAILLWLTSAFMLVPFKEWLTFNHEYNGAKFICVIVGLLVVTRAYKAFKSSKAI